MADSRFCLGCWSSALQGPAPCFTCIKAGWQWGSDACAGLGNLMDAASFSIAGCWRMKCCACARIGWRGCTDACGGQALQARDAHVPAPNRHHLRVAGPEAQPESHSGNARCFPTAVTAAYIMSSGNLPTPLCCMWTLPQCMCQRTLKAITPFEMKCQQILQSPSG